MSTIPRTVLLLVGTTLTLSMLLGAQPKDQHFPLESATGLRLHNVTAEPATHLGRKGLHVTMTDAAVQRLKAMTPEDRDRATKTGDTVEQLAIIEGTQFGNGVIEAEIAGAPRPGLFEGARGFVGIAFRLASLLIVSASARVTGGWYRASRTHRLRSACG